MDRQTTYIEIMTPDAMVHLGQRLARQLGAGDLVLLAGGIGAGKSLLCRALIRSLLTEPEDVPSPTFTLVQTYDAAQFQIWHCDLYRLTTIDQVDELGLIDAFDDSLVLVEWPELILADAPESHIAIQIDIAPASDKRNVTISTPTGRMLTL